jgi:hypothetical protein
MKLLTEKNYLSAIKKSVGAKLFQNVFADIDGVEKDITNNGELSCALFVSSLLMMFHLIDASKAPHTTVSGLLKNMMASEWEQITEKELKEGDVIVWKKIIDTDGEVHEHIGFYIGNDKAISNSSEKHTPEEHHYKYNGNRAIESCWRS